MYTRSSPLLEGNQGMDAPTILLRKLESIGEVSIEDRQALTILDHRVRYLAPRDDVLRDGEEATDCCLLIDGLMHRYKVLPDGTRQILGFHTPGEIPDLFSLHVRRADHNLASVGPCTVALIAHADLHTFLTRYPDIKDLFWRDTLLQAAISQAWIIGLGRRSARARLAHLFCELFCRLAAIGLANRIRCPLRLTQADLGDALGLSTVHINRTLQELRRDGLLNLESGCLTIHNWDRLAATGGFDPAYLNLATCQTHSMLPSRAHNGSRSGEAERPSGLASQAM
jgi:CRP-like cAMP-binding protein